MAHVSIATVSYVMNDRGNVSAATRRRVREVADALGYHPNSAGRALASRRSRAIGIVLPMQSNRREVANVNILAGLADGLRNRGHDVVLFASRTTEEQTWTAVYQDWRAKRINGFVCLAEKDLQDLLRMHAGEQGIPSVWLGETPDHAWVDFDHHHGGKLATEYLLGLGHRSLAHVAVPGMRGLAIRRGFEDTMRELVPSVPILVESAKDSIAEGYQAMHRLAMAGVRLIAVFAGSDLVAEGILRAAGELSLAVPQQLSVIGYGDRDSLMHTIPALTTVTSRGYSLGHLLAEVAVDRMEHEKVRGALSVPTLEIRGSCTVIGHYQTPKRDRVDEVIKRAGVFAVFSDQATIDPQHLGTGLYYADTRMVHVYRMYCNQELMLPVSVERHSHALSWEYVLRNGTGTITFSRVLTLNAHGWIDRWDWHRFGDGAEPLDLAVQVGCDFHDIFELRGMQPGDRGQLHQVVDGGVTHRYEGLDGKERGVTVSMSDPKALWEGDHFRWTLAPEKTHGGFSVACTWSNAAASPSMLKPVETAVNWPTVATNRTDWAAVLDKSREDLQMLLTDFGSGPMLMAGLPWFGTVLGRDAVWSALELLEWVPVIAQNTIATLAHWQGESDRPDREEEPGKIVHEIRLGEWANCRKVPFGRYYGSIDVTPLFVSLYGKTLRRTNEQDWGLRFLPAVRSALRWIQGQIQRGNRHCIYQFSPRGRGLEVQTWKDSQDSMVYSDGHRAVPPLASAQVQGYVYDALKEMAWVLSQLNDRAEQNQVESQARQLQQGFQRRFWRPHQRYYAMAIDGQDQSLDVVSSDIGHCLWSGIIPTDFQQAVVHRLGNPDLFSGFGIRTLSSQEVAYDPFSTHRGSVWPHDTAIAVAGMDRVGAWNRAGEIGKSLMQAAYRFPGHRLPESFSGEPRERTAGPPLSYPSTCILRDWAAASPWMILQSMMGLRIDARRRQIFLHPLPSMFGDAWFRISGLCLTPGNSVSLHVTTSVARVEGLPTGWQQRGWSPH